MKTVLLIGLGRFGRHIAEKMNMLKHQVMAIDKNEERVEKVLPFVTNAQIGDSTKKSFMESLGVRDFDLCIVAIGDNFQSSLETTLLLKELGAQMIVARASRDVHAKFLLRNGADDVVYPEKQLAGWTAIRYSSRHILDYVDLGEGYGVYELDIPSAWYRRTVGDLEIRRKYNLNILGIRRHGKMEMNITPLTLFEAQDTVLVLGNYKSVQKYFHI